MTRRTIGALLLAATLLVTGCTDSATRVTVGITAKVTTRLPDLAGPAELEEALVSYGECVQQSFPIAMRFRVDAFTGMETEIGTLHKEDGDQVDRVAAECNAELDLDRRLGVYQGEHPITPADRQKLVEDFTTCVEAVSTDMADRVAAANLDTRMAVDSFVSALVRQASEFSRAELVAVSDCQAEMSGPRAVFDDGYPWFTP